MSSPVIRQWMVTKEAASYLGVSLSWLYRHKKDLPPSYRIGPTYRYLISDLELWVEQQRRS